MVENKVMSLKEVYEKWKKRDLDYILTNLEDFGSVHECINDLWLAVKVAVDKPVQKMFVTDSCPSDKIFLFNPNNGIEDTYKRLMDIGRDVIYIATNLKFSWEKFKDVH